MTREIKFRAWIPKVKEMAFVQAMMWDKDISIKIEFNSDKDFSGPGGGYELMQYTGFKDKDGAEVWESDVMKTQAGELYLIAWHPNTASFTAHYNGDLLEKAYFSYVTAKRWEVIGDIHQNPELLK